MAYALSVEMKKPYVILRKAYKPYMGNALQHDDHVHHHWQTANAFLDEKRLDLMKGKNVVIVDDVISTGSTLQAMRQIVEKAGSKISAEAAIFTEGEEAKWAGIISLGHLPVFCE
jgi:adenine phosphoribosyltransferase